MPDADTTSKATTDVTADIEAASASVRDTAKWLAGGLGAIGAAFAVGAQLTSLGAVTELWRLLVAAVAIAIGLAAKAIAVYRTTDVLLPQRLDLNAVAELPGTDPVRIYLEASAAEVLEGVARSVSGDDGFRKLYYQAIDARSEAYAAQAAQPDVEGLREEALRLDGRVAYLNTIAGKIVSIARYERLRDQVPDWRRWVIGCALVVAVAIVVFAWAANPPKASGVGLDLRGAKLVGADLSGSVLSGADLTGADLTRTILRNTKLDDAVLVRVTWSGTTCPDGSDSDHVGGTCEGHLK